MEKAFIWCDCDLDGAMSYTTLCWYLEYDIPFRPVTVKDFEQQFSAWIRYNKDKYEKIFIVDLDVSGTDPAIIDLPNVVIIDHHKSHKNEYKNATAIVELETSCTKLIYKTVSKKLNITDEQKYLVLLADDYDSYKLQVKDSYNLNVVYWAYRGNRVQKFYTDFKKGFKGFNNFHKNIILLHSKKFSELKRNLEPYKAFLVIKGKEIKFVACFADSCINELADYVINKYKADVGVIVNLNTSRFSLRRSKACSIDLSMLINKIGTGGGHEYAAGGEMNDKFITFSKLLIPIHEQVSTSTERLQPKSGNV